MPEGQIELAEPPVMGEPAGADFGSALMYLPMALGTGAMVLMFSMRSAGTTTYMMSGMMGVSMVGMTISQLGGPAASAAAGCAPNAGTTCAT